MKPCQLTLVVFWGSHDPRQIGITTWSESVHLCRVKIDISAVLTDTSGPDSHMIRTWLTWTMEGAYGLRWLPRVLVGWLSRVLWGCYPMFLIEVATSVIIIIMMMFNNNCSLYSTLIKGWDIILTVVTRCSNKSYQLKMLTYSQPYQPTFLYKLCMSLLSACTCWVRRGLTLAIITNKGCSDDQDLDEDFPKDLPGF